MSKTWDAVVIGAGPAGASCAVWLRHLGFEPLLIEASDRVGGLAARNPYPDIWTVTSPNQTGEQVAAQIAAQVQASGVTLWTHACVQGISGSARSFDLSVSRDNGQTQVVNAKTVVIASGVKPRGLPGQSQEKFEGVLVGPGQQVMSHDYEGLRVAILGGGDNAFENHEFVRQRGAQTAHVFARTVRAQRQYQQRAAPEDVFVGPCKVNLATREVNGNRYDLIMVFYGWEPQVSFVDGLALTSQGFLATDMATAQTSTSGIYAIGEVAQRMHPCVPTAMADGVVAAKAIERVLNKAAESKD